MCYEFQAENPGPGRYDLAKPPIIGNLEFNKKGYGAGFISKSQRFRHDYETIAKPGPGRYEASQDIVAIAASHTPSRLGTAPFLAPGFAAVAGKVVEMPGPGTYDLLAPPPARYSTPLSPAFQPGKRFHSVDDSASLPGAGSYNIGGDMAAASNNPGVLLQSKAERGSLVSAGDGARPGPGSYNVPMGLELSDPAHRSPAFAPLYAPTSPLTPKSPNVGPGAYDPVVPKSPYYAPGVSSFRSVCYVSHAYVFQASMIDETLLLPGDSLDVFHVFSSISDVLVSSFSFSFILFIFLIFSFFFGSALYESQIQFLRARVRPTTTPYPLRRNRFTSTRHKLL